MRREAVTLTGARLAFGDRVLWDNLDLSVAAGEFIAVLGPNGTGKTSLLKVLLGLLPLSAGKAMAGGPIGYVPQHHPMDREVILRGRDLVGLGVDGHRWGAVALRAWATFAATSMAPAVASVVAPVVAPVIAPVIAPVFAPVVAREVQG